MTDGQAGEPAQGTPGTRALGAMEKAVRRVRATSGMSPSESASAPRAGTTSVEGGHDGHLERWLVTAIVVVATLVVVGSAALAASLTNGTSPIPAPAATAPAAPATGHPYHAQRGPARIATRGGGSSAPTTSTTVAGAAPTPGGPPVISGLVPATGAPGQGIEVAGTNFLSPNGQIVATFNGQVAPTSCPAQNSCTVTVPPLTGTSRASVTITTADGTSNAVTFTFS